VSLAAISFDVIGWEPLAWSASLVVRGRIGYKPGLAVPTNGRSTKKIVAYRFETPASLRPKSGQEAHSFRLRRRGGAGLWDLCEKYQSARIQLNIGEKR